MLVLSISEVWDHVKLNPACSVIETSYNNEFYTYSSWKAKNQGVAQTMQMCSPVCAFAVRKHKESALWNLSLIGWMALEEKMFENVEGRMKDLTVILWAH